MKEINTARQRLKAVRARTLEDKKQEKKHGGRTQ
jgi:hypothetical protein